MPSPRTFGGIGYRGYRTDAARTGNIFGGRPVAPNTRTHASTIGNYGNHGNREGSSAASGYRGYRGYRLQRHARNMLEGRRVLGDDRAQGLMARYADAPVVLTGPQAAAGLVQRLRWPRHRKPRRLRSPCRRSRPARSVTDPSSICATCANTSARIDVEGERHDDCQHTRGR